MLAFRWPFEYTKTLQLIEVLDQGDDVFLSMWSVNCRNYVDCGADWYKRLKCSSFWGSKEERKEKKLSQDLHPSCFLYFSISIQIYTLLVRFLEKRRSDPWDQFRVVWTEDKLWRLIDYHAIVTAKNPEKLHHNSI